MTQLKNAFLVTDVVVVGGWWWGCCCCCCFLFLFLSGLRTRMAGYETNDEEKSKQKFKPASVKESPITSQTPTCRIIRASGQIIFLQLYPMLLSVVSVRDIIENSSFFVPQYMLSFNQNLSSFDNQKVCSTLTKKGIYTIYESHWSQKWQIRTIQLTTTLDRAGER